MSATAEVADARRHPDGPVVVVLPDAAAVDTLAARFVADGIGRGDYATVAFPTGSTPVGMYRDLVRRIRHGEVSFAGMMFFQLDEFRALTLGDPDSFATWLRRHILDAAGVEDDRFHLVPSLAADPAEAGRAFEEQIDRAGGLDLVVLGIGNNGHVAFNEPGSAADSRTRALHLSDETIQQTGQTWTGQIPVPREAVTMGVGTLRDAHRSLLLAKGAAKATAIRLMLLDAPSPETPASFMRAVGERLTVLADAAAAANILAAMQSWPEVPLETITGPLAVSSPAGADRADGVTR